MIHFKVYVIKNDNKNVKEDLFLLYDKFLGIAFCVNDSASLFNVRLYNYIMKKRRASDMTRMLSNILIL